MHRPLGRLSGDWWWSARTVQKSGPAGHRSQYLSHAKRALYHLSYRPFLNSGRVSRISIVVRTAPSHGADLGSIPRSEVFCLSFFYFLLPLLFFHEMILFLVFPREGHGYRTSQPPQGGTQKVARPFLVLALLRKSLPVSKAALFDRFVLFFFRFGVFWPFFVCTVGRFFSGVFAIVGAAGCLV